MMSTEAAAHADFSFVRYAQVWEDADILLEALNIKPGASCLSISSAGDNALAMLACDPERVIALDLNKAQLACLELRIAAYRELTHTELLEFIGSRPSKQRSTLWNRCTSHLSVPARSFWEANPGFLEMGFGCVGKFENYFRTFRTRMMPLVHSSRTIDELLRKKSKEERISFYRDRWDNWQWRLLFRLFFSRTVMGRMGRDQAFFRYVEGAVADEILRHTKYALTELAPSENPYLQFILKGRHTTALPFALREENYHLIRKRLDRIEWHALSIEEFLQKEKNLKIDAFNLSDIFEYMSEESMQNILEDILNSSTTGARIAYWNMLVPRQCPDSLSGKIRSLPELSESLHQRDKAFFYSKFIVEEVI